MMDLLFTLSLLCTCTHFHFSTETMASEATDFFRELEADSDSDGDSFDGFDPVESQDNVQEVILEFSGQIT